MHLRCWDREQSIQQLAGLCIWFARVSLVLCSAAKRDKNTPPEPWPGDRNWISGKIAAYANHYPKLYWYFERKIYSFTWAAYCVNVSIFRHSHGYTSVTMWAEHTWHTRDIDTRTRTVRTHSCASIVRTEQLAHKSDSDTCADIWEHTHNIWRASMCFG